MAVLSFTVPEEWDGKSLDSFLRQHYRLSGTTIKRARQTEMGLAMDGAHIRTVDPVRAGAVITVTVDAQRRQYRPSGVPVAVLFRDGGAAVLDKPAGMPCHPSRGHPYDSLANAFASMEGFDGLPFRPIGRLDKDTSGAVVCALHSHAAFTLTENRPEKGYLAIVSPPPGLPAAEIEAPIARETAGSIKRCVSPGGQYALTRYKTLLSDGEYALLSVGIATGRTHQIRVHMAHIGSPLAGDALYGGDLSFLGRHALHCARVSFCRPMGGERVSAVSPLAEDMEKFLSRRFGDAALRAALEKFYPPE